MNNQNDNQTNPLVNDQDIINQYASSTNPNQKEIPQQNISTQNLDDKEVDSSDVQMFEAPKATSPLDDPNITGVQPSQNPIDSIPPQPTETTNLDEKESLKEFNSTPIDTPTPVSLSDNLEASKSITKESSFTVEDKPQVTSESEIKSYPKPKIEPNPNLNFKTELQPQSQTETSLQSEPEPTLEPKRKLETNLETKIKTEPDFESKIEPEIKFEPITSTELLPPKPLTSNSPEDIKQKIEEVLSYKTANDTINSQSDKPKTSRFIKVLFTFSLLIFLAIAGNLAYFFLSPIPQTESDIKPENIPTTTPIQSSVTCELNGSVYNQNQSFPAVDGCNTCTCKSSGEIDCTDNECSNSLTTQSTVSAIKTSVTPTKSVTSSVKTPFQKMVINLSLYKDITDVERSNSFSGTTGPGDFWPSWVKSTDKLYSLAQQIIKGSIKTLTIDKDNFTSIMDKSIYNYTFYITPNYEKWTNEEFKNLDYKSTRIGDLTPLYAYPDKLIWTTRRNCGGAKAEGVEEIKAQDQCKSLVEEMLTAFP